MGRFSVEIYHPPGSTLSENQHWLVFDNQDERFGDNGHWLSCIRG